MTSNKERVQPSGSTYFEGSGTKHQQEALSPDIGQAFFFIPLELFSSSKRAMRELRRRNHN